MSSENRVYGPRLSLRPFIFAWWGRIWFLKIKPSSDALLFSERYGTNHVFTIWPIRLVWGLRR